MANLYKNKIVYGNDVLMDITDTTATPDGVVEGQVFYGANGARNVGSLGLVTTTKNGLMAAVDKAKLDGINIYCKTTAELNNDINFIPERGAIVIYLDHNTMIDDVSGENAITLVNLYPDLKSSELVTQEINIHTENNAKIKELKEKQIDIRTYKWWLYFGGK